MIIQRPSYIRAARALLNWSVKDLSSHCGVHWNTLLRIEGGKQKPEIDTLQAIQNALLRGGVRITDKGVEEVSQTVTMLYDYSDVLRDALMRLSAGDALWLDCADERRNSEDVTRLFQEIERKGIVLRYLAQEGDCFFTTNPSNYRWIDKATFANAPVRTVYADRFVEHVNGENKELFIMITCPELAQARARQIEAAWNRGSLPCLEQQGKNTEPT